jgi:hypothetical protein
MEKMYCYLWHETTDIDECKFGERWVKKGQDPKKEVLKRIKESVGVRKDKFNDGTIELVAIWDVSELAKEVGRFKMHGRIDDYIRDIIGFRKNKTGEVHTLSAVDMAFKVNEFLKKQNQPLFNVGLSQNQYSAADNVLTAIAEGKRTIVAELCARFGKTIWSGALIRETEATLTIVASYVLTSFASFKKDLSAFEQFRDFVLVDTTDDDWENQVQSAVESRLQTVVFLSMCAGGRRQAKIDFLFGQDVNKLVIIDEADFGVHQSKQSTPLIEARGEDDVVILMTGTNGDKAASIWDVDHYLSVTYPELLMEKHADRLIV